MRWQRRAYWLATSKLAHDRTVPGRGGRVSLAATSNSSSSSSIWSSSLRLRSDEAPKRSRLSLLRAPRRRSPQPSNRRFPVPCGPNPGGGSDATPSAMPSSQTSRDLVNFLWTDSLSGAMVTAGRVVPRSYRDWIPPSETWPAAPVSARASFSFFAGRKSNANRALYGV